MKKLSFDYFIMVWNNLFKRFKNYSVQLKEKTIINLITIFPFLKIIFSSKKSRFYRISSLSKIINLNNVKILSKKEYQLSYIPSFYYKFGAKPQNPIEVKYNGLFILFNDVSIIGSSNILIINKNKALYELKEFNNNRFEYTDESLKCNNNIYGKINSNIRDTKINEAINLIGNFSWNYYHFLIEIAIKFCLINKSNLDSNVPILIDEVVKSIPQFQELVKLLNTKSHPLLFVSKIEQIKVANLYHFNSVNIIPPNIKKNRIYKSSDVLLNKEILMQLRDELINKKSNKKFPTRIFLSRSNASNRRGFNEKEVFDSIEKFGFKNILVDKLSFVEQLSLFQNAEFIIGGSGAAFTNLLFAKTYCKAVILVKNKLDTSIFSTIANFNNINLVYLSENQELPSDRFKLHASFNVNISRLDELINELLVSK